MFKVQVQDWASQIVRNWRDHLPTVSLATAQTHPPALARAA
jgi:hypothetical protein